MDDLIWWTAQTLMWAAIGLVLIFVVWAYYLAVMALKAGRDRGLLRTETRVAAAVLIAMGAPAYVLLNLTVGTILFLDPPRELQFTMRCRRHIETGSGWRYKLARWTCRTWLDPFEEGGHC